MGDIIKLPGMAESAEDMLRDLLAQAESGEIQHIVAVAVTKSGGLVPLWSPNHASNVVLAGHVLIDHAMTVLREGTAPGFEKMVPPPTRESQQHVFTSPSLAHVAEAQRKANAEMRTRLDERMPVKRGEDRRGPQRPIEATRENPDARDLRTGLDLRKPHHKPTTLRDITAADRGQLMEGPCTRCELGKELHSICHDPQCPHTATSKSANIMPFKSR